MQLSPMASSSRGDLLDLHHSVLDRLPPRLLTEVGGPGDGRVPHDVVERRRLALLALHVDAVDGELVVEVRERALVADVGR